MSNRVVRVGIYVGPLLLKETSTSNYEHNTNDEQGHGADGAEYFSTGNDTTTFDIELIVPKTGLDSQLKNILMGHQDVTVSAQVDGGVEKCNGRFLSRSYKSESKNGMTTVSAKFAGGRPQIV